ncbi:MAG TPA: CAP domain-containing protein [Chloroflexota bacterium]|nr:CAP domain-containing protein [Chloroflexota bacterium]
MRLHFIWLKGLILVIGLFSFMVTVPRPAAAAAINSAVEQQLLVAVNQDRVSAGLNPLTPDPRLTAVAEARAVYLVDRGFFSHCTGGEADPQCGQSGQDFVSRAAQAGIGVSVGGTTLAENLALNNYPLTIAASQTNSAWLNSPEHRASMLASRFAYTGVGVACCFSGSVGGQAMSAADNAFIYVQEFSGGPGAAPSGSGATAAQAGCRFVLGFAALAHDLPSHVGGCADNENHNPQNGDALQRTSTGGLLVWRKADNWTAFTDGFHSWVNGPAGVQERLNSQRFSWEANPGGLPVVS